MNRNVYYKGQVLWAHIDANRHLRHSAYADFAAQARSNILNSIGLSLDKFAKRKIGPILFREELKYYREVGLDELIEVSVLLTKLNSKNGRFSFKHVVYKENGIIAAEIYVDGAWLDLSTRKLTEMPIEWYNVMHQIPLSEDFLEIRD